MEKKFNVAIRNMMTPLSSLWALDVDSKKATRLTRDTSISVTDFKISDDGRWIGYHGVAASRYMRNITEQDINADLYLLETATGNIERLTNNNEVPEGDLEFSPDSKWIAFSAPADMTQYSMTNNRVYLRRVENRGGMFQQLGALTTAALPRPSARRLPSDSSTAKHTVVIPRPSFNHGARRAWWDHGPARHDVPARYHYRS